MQAGTCKLKECEQCEASTLKQSLIEWNTAMAHNHSKEADMTIEQIVQQAESKCVPTFVTAQ